MRTNFEQPKFFIEKESAENKERKPIEKLENLSLELAERLKKQGIPVDKECRVDMSPYTCCYPKNKIVADKKYVEQMERKWRKEMEEKNYTAEEIDRLERENKGRKLEMLKTIIFNKVFSKRFIAVRTSRYDDIVGGVDNILLDRKTGNVICALDEVESVNFSRLENDERYQKKVKETENKNKEGGATIKYGLTIKGDNVELKKLKHLPIFYIVLGKKKLDEGVDKMLPSLKRTGDFEEKLGAYFAHSLAQQSTKLILEQESLHPKLKERLTAFNRSLNNIFKES